MSDMTRQGDTPSEPPTAGGGDAVAAHRRYAGKVQIAAKCPIRGFDDFAVWYTPGVAAPCRAIAAEADSVDLYTNRGNSIAIVSDGTRVLGLGDIGPKAALPVMEGKALLFKHLGGVDAIPLCLGTRDAAALVDIVRALSPSFGAINLEDIEQPKCFRVLSALREALDIPIWHDDQQGSATAVLAGLLSALRRVGKRLDRIRIAMVGMGAANFATYRLLKVRGLDPAAVVACDSKGVLHRDRHDIAARRGEFAEKWSVCLETNAACRSGGIAQALRGADVCIAFSRPGPGVIGADAVAGMARDAIVFACANPVPEISPAEAHAAGARIVATGRSDFPNQVNNSLVFPGVFRGVLDVRARSITDSMALAAADALADIAEAQGASERMILPRMDDPEVAARLAMAVAAQAQREGVARSPAAPDDIYRNARRRILEARRMTEVLMRERIIDGAEASG